MRKHMHWLPVVVWMAFIFAMSTRLGSFDHTSLFIEPLIRWLCPGLSDESVHRVHGLIRKAGHLTEYAILALLAWRAVRSSCATWGAGRAAGAAWLVATAYAATDELHQAFVPGRTASVWDVLIDAAGAMAALLLALAWRRVRPKPTNREGQQQAGN